MIATTHALQAFLGAVTWESLAGLVLRATLVAGLGHLALLLLRPSAAATRHLVALAALAAVVALPLAAAVAPRHPSWTLTTPLLPPPPVAEDRAIEAVSPPAAVPGAGEVASVLAPHDTDRPSAGAIPSSPSAQTSPQSAAGPERPVLAGAARPDGPPPGSTPFRMPPSSWPVAVASVVALVAAVLLARLVAGMIAAGWAARRAAPVTDREAHRMLDAARRRLGIPSAVPLRMDPRLAVPVVTGFFRPVLVVPADASTWPAERLRAVFLHELAHVCRCDVVGLVLARVATALFWFHPLVWTLARAARSECERACDDVVISSGLRASDYADHLVAIARAAAGPGRSPGAALAFARRSSLEGRLLSLLRADARRGPVSARTRWAVGTALPCLLVALSSLRVVAAPSEAPLTDPGVEAQVAPLAADPSRSFVEIVADGPATSTWSLEPASGSVEAPPDARGDEARTPREHEKSKYERMHPEEKRVEGREHTAQGHEGRESGDTEIATTKSAAFCYSRGKRLFEAKRYEQAGVAFQSAAQGGYRPATSWYNAACSFAQAGQRLRALAALQEATRAGFDDLGHMRSDDDLNPLRGDSRFRLLVESLRSSESNSKARRSAVERYEALRAMRSRDADEWKAAGVKLMRSGEDARAAEAFGRQAALDSSPGAIYNQACALSLGGDRDRAIAALERAIVSGYGSGDKLRSDPDLFALHGDQRFAGLARLADDLTLKFVGKDDDPDAWRATVPRHERVAREHPDLGRAWFNLGFAQLRAGNPQGSRQSFSRALDLDYRRRTTTYNLACAAAQARDADDALRWLARSEAAGMELEQIAPQDDDLDPLRSDARFRALVERWEEHRRAEKAAQRREREKDRNKNKS